MDGIELYHGDCLDIMPQLPAQSVDLILADLPYGTTACAWDSIIPLEPMWAEYKRIIKPRGAIVLTASQPFTSVLVMSNPQWFRHEWIWIKNAGSNFANTVREPMKEHESVLVFSSGQWTYNMQRQARAESGLSRSLYKVETGTKSEVYRQFESRGPKSITQDRVPSSWQVFNRERGLHPTQKPLSLMQYLVLTYSNPGDVVLDNSMGSGTTGEAAIRTGRLFIGIEKDAGYFATARRRIESAQPSLFGAVYNNVLQPTADHAEVENQSHQPGLL